MYSMQETYKAYQLLNQGVQLATHPHCVHAYNGLGYAHTEKIKANEPTTETVTRCLDEYSKKFIGSSLFE